MNDTTSEGLAELLYARLASPYANGNTIPLSRTEAERIVTALYARPTSSQAASPDVVEHVKRVIAFELRRPEMSREPFDLDTFARNIIAAIPHAERIEALEREVTRLQEQLGSARQQVKRRGRDLLRDEADEVMGCFTPAWEPLREIAQRTEYSACQLASRARDLQRRGLVESKWAGTNYKLWRLKGRPVPVHASGGGQFHDPAIARTALGSASATEESK